MRKIKREYFNNLNKKNICDNKKFWRVVKPLLSHKIISNEKITIVEGDKIIRSDNKTAEVLNEFFAIIVTNLNILQFNQIDRTSENISDPVIKAIGSIGHIRVLLPSKKIVLLNLILMRK